MMRIQKVFILAGFISGLLIHANEAPGAVIYVKADSTGTTNGQSWDHAFTDLQDALTTATQGDEIWVAAGTYKPTRGADRTLSFKMPQGVAIYGGFIGTNETTNSQRNWTANPTILSGDIGAPGDNSDNSFTVITGAFGATLDGFTITGGNTAEAGGGMTNDCVAWMMVANCTFRGNIGGLVGGGMYNGSSSPTVSNCTFTSNTANFGGGMCNYNASPRVTNCTFTGNTSHSGGGMCNFVASPTVTNCIFTNNSGDNSGGGGGMDNLSSSPTVSYCSFTGNTTSVVRLTLLYIWRSSPRFSPPARSRRTPVGFDCGCPSIS